MDHASGETAASGFNADSVHRFFEKTAILGPPDGFNAGADELDIEFLKHTAVVQRHGCVKRGLSAHCGQQRIGTLFLNDRGHDLRCYRFEVSGVRKIAVGHDGSGVRIHEYDPVTIGAECAHGLRTRVIEFAGLSDDDGSCSDNENGMYVVTTRHGCSSGKSE